LRNGGSPGRVRQCQPEERSWSNGC
jgi:hypothetical protein